MIRPIVKSRAILSTISAEASPEDAQVGQDLLDTYLAHKTECVGMAANMIGELKRIIVFTDENGDDRLMYNPEIVSYRNDYMTREGCLSLPGTRETERYKHITLRYLDRDFIKRTERFDDWQAQIIQHEIDHCNGVII